MAVLITRPVDVGHYSAGWFSNNANPFWANLDEENEDGDTTYVYTENPGVFTVSFGNPAFGAYVQPTRVGSTKLIATLRVDGAIPTKFKLRARHLGKDYDSEEYTTTSNTYIEIVQTYFQCPDGNGWNLSNLSSMEFGVVYVEGSELRVTKMELQVEVELYNNQTLQPTDVNPSFQDWHNHPGTAGAHLSVGPFDGGRSYIYSNTLWKSLTTNIATDLWGCYGFASDDVFAVGVDGKILHWNGTAWAQQESGTEESLLSVWGSSPIDVFAVGTLGTILHYDGLVWTAMISGTTNRLYGVWGLASNDVYAVGDGGLILHYNGVAWAPMASPVVTVLYDVWGFDATNVYACGAGGSVVYYNGAVWISIPTGSAQSMYGVWGAAANDVFVVGDVGEIWRWNGAVWAAQTSGTTFNLKAVYGASATDVVAVGYSGIAIRWDGSVWKEQPTYSTDNLLDVWGTLSTNLFAVGVGGVALHYDEVAWEPISVFELSNFITPTNPPNVDRVQISALVKNMGTTEARAAVVARSGATNYLGATSSDGWMIPVDGNWHLIEEEYLNAPTTGWPSGSPGSTPWNSAEVDLLEVGVKNIGGNLRCTTIVAETFQKYTPISTFDMFPTSDGYYQDYNTVVPPQPPGSNWQNIDEDPPDYGVTYLGADANAAGTTQYGTFGVGPAIGAFPAGEQVYCVEVRCTVALGATESATVAPLVRYNNETYVGRSFVIDNTGASWFDVKQDYFTSPYTGDPWTAAEVDAAEYGMVVLDGEAYLNRLRVQVQTAPVLSGTPDPDDLQLADEAFGVTGFVTRSTAEGIIYAVTEFAVGTGGFNPTIPTTVTPVNPADTALINEIYRSRIQSITYDTSAAPWQVTYWCRVPKDVAIDTIGELALFAEVIWSPVPAEIGTKFIFAIQHMPCQSRHPKTAHLYRVTIEYP